MGCRPSHGIAATSWRYFTADDLGDTCCGEHRPALGLYEAEGIVATEEMPHDSHRLGIILVNSDQQVILLTRETQTLYGDTTVKNKPS